MFFMVHAICIQSVVINWERKISIGGKKYVKGVNLNIREKVQNSQIWKF